MVLVPACCLYLHVCADLSAHQPKASEISIDLISLWNLPCESKTPTTIAPSTLSKDVMQHLLCPNSMLTAPFTYHAQVHLVPRNFITISASKSQSGLQSGLLHPCSFHLRQVNPQGTALSFLS